jgi:tetratricopeptide (TPR) repeat protein
LTRLGQVDDAVRSYQQSLAIHEAVEGPRHPNTATSAHNLAVTYRDLGRLDDARALFERAFGARRESLGPTHPDTLSSELALDRTCIAEGDFELAALLLSEVRASFGEGSTLRDQWSLSSAEAELSLLGGFWKEALAVSTRLSELAQALQPGDSPQALAAALVRGRALTGLGNWAGAHRALSEAERLAPKVDAVDQADVEEALGRLASAQGSNAEALTRFERALALRERGLATPELGDTLLALARCRIDAGRADDAVELGARAERLFVGMQVKNAVPRARWVLAEARWLSGADGGVSSQDVEEAAAALPATELDRARRWLRAHGVTPDGGSP